MHPIEVNLPLEKRIKKEHFLLSDYTLVKNIDAHYDAARRISRYLEQVHDIELSEGFVQNLLNAHCKFNRHHPFYMDYRHVDSVVTACEFWKDYISPDQFSNLVCGEIISFAEIHTSVIQAPKIESVQGIKLVSPLDFRFGTIVSKSGEVARCI